MKAYVKPDLYYENFEMSEHIASCYYRFIDNQDKNNCHARSSATGITWFTNIWNCGLQVIDPNRLCEKTWAETFNTFNS